MLSKSLQGVLYHHAKFDRSLCNCMQMYREQIDTLFFRMYRCKHHEFEVIWTQNTFINAAAGNFCMRTAELGYVAFPWKEVVLA
jgi:hypothetical protein